METINQAAEKAKTDVLKGGLIISKSNGVTQYYRFVNGKKKYIPVKDTKLISGLAQNSYNDKILRLTRRRLEQIRDILKDYDDNEIENVFLNEGVAKNKWIKPFEITWEQMLQSWLEKEYEKKGFAEDAPVIFTEKGERVRSKSEKIMADYFYRNGIPYKYEAPLYLKHFGLVHPDFTFLSPKTRKEIYWEHDGRMGDPDYASNAVKKINAYASNGIFPGENLIITYETDKIVLDTRLLELYVNKYLI